MTRWVYFSFHRDHNSPITHIFLFLLRKKESCNFVTMQTTAITNHWSEKLPIRPFLNHNVTTKEFLNGKIMLPWKRWSSSSTWDHSPAVWRDFTTSRPRQGAADRLPDYTTRTISSCVWCGEERPWPHQWRVSAFNYKHGKFFLKCIWKFEILQFQSVRNWSFMCYTFLLI